MKKKEALKEVDPLEAKRLVQSMAIIINNSVKHYWFSRADAEEAILQCHTILAAILDKVDTLSFRVIEKKLLLNMHAVDEEGSAFESMIQHMMNLEIENFMIMRGILREHFVSLMEILEGTRDALIAGGGFAKVLETKQLKNIIMRKVILQEVTEEEVVVDKTDLEGVGPGNGSGSEQGSGAVDTANILAFLKGEAAGQNIEITDKVQNMVSDAEKMAEMIMQAANIGQTDKPVENPETLIDFVVGCLKRTHDAMTAGKAATTKAGRKRITKNLLLIEEEILKRMREMSTQWTEEDLAAITDAVEEMTDEIKIDAIVEEYVDKRRAIEKSEEQLLDYIRSKGVNNISDINLQKKLSERGIGIDGWRELVFKSGAGTAGDGTQGAGVSAGQGGSGSGGGMVESVLPVIPSIGGMMGQVLDAINHLGNLLDTMEKQFEKDDEAVRQKNSEALVQAFVKVNTTVAGLVADAGVKIEELLAGINSDKGSVLEIEDNALKSGISLKYTRGQVLSMVAFIVHQLSEPLALVSSSIDMVVSKSLGGVSAGQKQILILAQDNIRKISSLLESLEKMGARPSA